MIVGAKSGARGVIKSDSRGNYVYPITMRRKKRKESTEMDIGFAGPNKFEPLAEKDEEETEEEDEYERAWCL